MLNRFFHSERYLGARKHNYFEGWYFKADGLFPFAYIVGVSKAKQDPHSFIQYADCERSLYERFSLSDFSFTRENMAICVAGNRFSLKGIRAKLNGKNGTAETDVGFARAALYKKSFWAPSVMGPFSYLPMPCSHAVVSLRHSVTGSHTVCGENYPIDGFGYIEKDFGKSFPANYVWVQGFLGDTSVIAAVAWPLPLIKRGFLCLILHAGVQYNLSLYTGAKLTVSELSPESARFTLKKRDCSVSFDIRRASAVSLSAPEKGGVMNAVIEESLCAEAKIDLTLNGRKIAVSRVVPVTFESVNRPEKS